MNAHPTYNANQSWPSTFMLAGTDSGSRSFRPMLDGLACATGEEAAGGGGGGGNADLGLLLF